jgi:hypothetical protein
MTVKNTHYILGCIAVQSHKSLQTCKWNALLSLPGSKIKLNEQASKQSRLSAPRKQETKQIFLLGLRFDPEEGGSMFLRNFVKLLSD